MSNVLYKLQNNREKGLRSVAVLIDPDDEMQHIEEVAETALLNGVTLFLVGGSLVTTGNTSECVKLLKGMGVPQVVLFPGHEIQVVAEADAILFMSLISGRNPEFLISKQVNAAPWVAKSGLEAIPCGYMLVESGKLTSAVYMSHTQPLPNDKPDIAAATALAGEMLGMRVFYLDAGSGAAVPVPAKLISRVAETVQGLIIVGGGIVTARQAADAWDAGAHIVVVGNGAFQNPVLLQELMARCNQMNSTVAGL